MNINPAAITEPQLAGLLEHLHKEEAFVFLETTRVDQENCLSFLFLDQVNRLICNAADDPGVFMATAQSYLDQGYYLAGSFAYEFGLLLEDTLAHLVDPKTAIVAELGVYRRPFVYDHRRGDFVGDKPWPDWDVAEAVSAEGYLVSNLTFSQKKEEYLGKIAAIKNYIESGDTYQVNYTLKLLFDYHGSDSAFYRALRRNQSVSYGAFIKDGERRVLSFSPELFFRKKGNACVVRPMKGTMGRGPSLERDLLIRQRLAGDSKNRSENIMIVDLLRNDLGKLCVLGKVDAVSLFDVETYETLHQMTSCLKGELKPDVDLLKLFRAIFPCGSVTGAPKIRTMEIISALESGERGIYTGGIGFISPDGEAIFNVPIRTVVLNNCQGEMGIGSGIVYDSDPEKEWDECLLKGKFLQATLPAFELVETFLYSPGSGYWLLERHLERLENSALYWGFCFSRAEITGELTRIGATLEGKDHCLVRLLLDKDGSLKVKAAPALAQTCFIEKRGKELPLVKWSSARTDSTNPFFYHKTTCRPLYDAERGAAVAAGFFEVLFCNERAEVTEGSITNIFIQRGDELLTPPLNCGLLGGVLRGALLAGEVAAPEGLRVVEKVLSVGDVINSEAIYLGNSVRGLFRVNLAAAAPL